MMVSLRFGAGRGSRASRGTTRRCGSGARVHDGARLIGVRAWIECPRRHPGMDQVTAWGYAGPLFVGRIRQARFPFHASSRPGFTTGASSASRMIRWQRGSWCDGWKTYLLNLDVDCLSREAVRWEDGSVAWVRERLPSAAGGRRRRIPDSRRQAARGQSRRRVPPAPDRRHR